MPKVKKSIFSTVSGNFGQDCFPECLFVYQYYSSVLGSFQRSQVGKSIRRTWTVHHHHSLSMPFPIFFPPREAILTEGRIARSSRSAEIAAQTSHGHS